MSEKIRLTESELVKLIKKVISEQSAAEYNIGTDKNRISNEILQTRFGLPKSSKSNDYFSSNTLNILNHALSGQPSNFLSIFKPMGEDAGSYHDYLAIGNKTMEVDEEGVPSPAIVVNFEGPNQTVIASRNGLLVIYRAMDEMRKIKRPITATLKFGKETTTQGKAKDRESSGIVFKLENAKKPYFGTIVGPQALVTTVNPYFKDLIKDENLKLLSNYTTDQMKQFLLKVINQDIQGTESTQGFVEANHKEQVSKIKGWVSTINPDLVNKIVDIYVSLQTIPDSNEGVLNRSKGNQIINESRDSLLILLEEMKKIFLNNLNLYLKTYLPNTSAQLFREVSENFQPRFDITAIPNWYSSLFLGKGKIIGVLPPKTDVKQIITPHKSGN